MKIRLNAQRLLTDPSPRLREALRYTIYGRNSNFDAERFIDVMEAFETFTVAAKSGGGEEMQGSSAFSGAVAGKSPAAGGSLARVGQQGGVQTRAALSFLISEQGEFFREFILDEVFTILYLTLCSKVLCITLLPLTSSSFVLDLRNVCNTT